MKLLLIARSLVVSATLAAFFLTAGCQSSRIVRIQENPALFQSLDRRSQKLVQDGLVDYGFSSDLVHLALGQPNRLAVVDSADGRVETWTYRNFRSATPSPVKMSMSDFGPLQPGGPIFSTRAPDGPGFGDPRTGGIQPTRSDGRDMPITLILELLEGRVIRIRVVP